MTMHRRAAAAPRFAVVLIAALLATGSLTSVLPAAAQAHGAPQNPISRALACGPEGGQHRGGAACQAAIAAGGSLEDWDYIRVANVRGQDRQKIPDGKLCSGGIDQYRGLDLPRADWPATALTSGAEYSFSYRETIPHPGSFRMYVTKDSYEPTRALRWADLETAPFLTATDPALQGNTYVMKGRLPTGKTGRHLIYTIWQNSTTPDTYYSCSDVVFAVAGPPTATQAPPKGLPTDPATQPPSPAADIARPEQAASATATGLPPVLVGVLVALLLAAVVAVVLGRRRHRR